MNTYLKKVINIMLFSIIIFSYVFNTFNYVQASSRNETPKITNAHLIHSPFIEGHNNALCISSKGYDGKVQYAISYITIPNSMDNLNVVSSPEMIKGWTTPVSSLKETVIDISHLNLPSDCYEFRIRVKRPNITYEDENKSYDDEYSFIVDVVKETSKISEKELKTLPNKTDIAPDKIWSIIFNEKIDSTTVNNENIKIVDFYDNEVSIKIEVSQNDKKTLLLYPPKNGYALGKTYKLILKKGIKSINGLPSNKQFIMNFTIKDSISNEEENNNKDTLNENLIEELLTKNSSKFRTIISNPEKYEVQILYTEIERDKDNTPTFTSYKYRVDPNKYFYPASSVKLSACMLALEKINNLNIDGLNKDSIVNIDKNHSGQSKEYGQTISNYIKKILLYSDNNSFSRLYEFLGQKYYNETLWDKSYTDVKIMHRLSGNCGFEQNRYTNPMTFYSNGKKVYYQSEQYNENAYVNSMPNLKRGKGQIIRGQTYYTPKDFSKKNYMSIEALQTILKAVFFNEYLPKTQRFNLTKDDFDFLKKHMAGYGNGDYKYFICGSNGTVPKDIKIYNKIGQAYGYLIDNAYIVNEKENVEFLLTAVVYTNKNEIFNDNVYEYYTVGMPFLKNLGNMFYDYNLNKNINKNNLINYPK